MELIPDDPIIECMMRTGYPWWMLNEYMTELKQEVDDDSN